MPGRTENYLQRRVERLTLFGAVRLVATVALTLAFVAACLELLVDSGINGFGTAVWWAIVTVTTVGYGDTFPTSVVGRLVASFLMVVGIGFLGLATASIAGHFVNQDADDKHRESTDKQEEILAELRRVHDRLDRLDARH